MFSKIQTRYLSWNFFFVWSFTLFKNICKIVSHNNSEKGNKHLIKKLLMLKIYAAIKQKLKKTKKKNEICVILRVLFLVLKNVLNR